MEGGAPLVLLAAGGTGGHLFPAQALAAALASRGVIVDLATDERAERYGGAFPARQIHIIPSETMRSRNPFALLRTGAILGAGLAKAFALLGRIKPAAVVGFGGYPTMPPLFAATLRGIPTIIHEQNAVMGRANRLLAPRVTAIATGFDGVLGSDPVLAAKGTRTGNPVRPAVIAAAHPYDPPDPSGPFNLVVFGGSQGARIMADIVPPAIELLEPHLQMRIRIVQQAREEDLARVRETYAGLKVHSEIAPFFADLPARIAAAHLVVGRAGASTVAELAVLGRPAILVPLPHALDQDQMANAGVLEKAGGAIRLRQEEFTPARLAAEITQLAVAADRLAAMAAAAAGQGTGDSAERLADLVMQTMKTTTDIQPSEIAMKLPRDIGPIHFVGIGGIGMSGIAEVLCNLGYTVSGSDVAESANVKRLREQGIKVAVGHDSRNIDGAHVVVVSSAIKRDNPELVAARALRIPVVRRAEMLAELMRLKRCVAVAGTHGKTTTTSLVAALLDAGNFDPTVINGGIINAYGTNARLGAGDWMVVEADEFDGTFLKLPADIAIVTNVDPEHLDHFKTFDAVQDAFRAFVDNVPFYGFAVMCIDHPVVQTLVGRMEDRRIITYGENPQADVRLTGLHHQNGSSRFSVTFRDRTGAEVHELKNATLPMPGRHNALNATAAIAVAHELGVADEAIRKALQGFGGVKRRFTRTGEWNGVDRDR